MVFNNTNDERENPVSMKNIKANPSVYSPNDGSFNSEENMRWAVKKLATKPFIVGDTDDIVGRNAKNLIVNFSNSSLSEGIFSIDGYTFKIAAQDRLSYDIPCDGRTVMYLENRYTGKFISDLTGYTKQASESLENNIDDICLEQYRPSGYSESTWQDLQDLWNGAYVNKNYIGAVRLVYSGECYSAITNTGTSLIFNGGESIRIEQNQSISNLETDGKVNVDYIANNSLFGNPTKPFALVNVSSYNIYYPVYVNYDNSVYFTDIFGITFTKKYVGKCYTKCYPYTYSTFVDMDNNAPMTAIDGSGSIVSCKRKTYPEHIWDWKSLYTISGSNISRKTNTDVSHSVSFPDISTVFDVFEISNQTQFPEGTSIRKVDNTLKYYCLKDVTYGQDEKPVAFMTSDGKLCPFGFIGSNPNNNDAPLVGYATFIQDLLNSNLPLQEVFNDYLAGPISFYLNLCYSSLMENVIHASGANDSDKIKSDGCGISLSALASQTPVLENGDFDVKYTYSYTGFTVSDSGAVTPQLMETIISYSKDITSDNYKIDFAKVHKYLGSNEANIKIYEDPDSTATIRPFQEFDYIVSAEKYDSNYDDIANYLKKCSNTTAPSGYTNITFKLYDIINTGIDNTSFIAFSDIPISNETFLPKNVTGKQIGFLHDHHLLAILQTDNYGSESLANSLKYNFDTENWSACLPHIITLRKDSNRYLAGLNIETGKYDGIDIKCVLPSQVTPDDLYLCDSYVATNRSCRVLDVEANDTTNRYDGNKFKVRRAAFLHTSKIYGDNEMTFEECVESIVNSMSVTGDLEERVRKLENTVDGDGTISNPGLKKIIYGDPTLDIDGVLNDIDSINYNIDSLKIRVGSLEKRANKTDLEILNLTEASGMIGQNAMYNVKKFGVTNINGRGPTFDFMSSEHSSPSEMTALCDADYFTDVCVGNYITAIGKKTFYHCAKLEHINSGNIMSVEEQEVGHSTYSISSSITLVNKKIVPLSLEMIISGKTYKDDGIGNIYLENTKKGSIDYENGIITLNVISSGTASIKYSYYKYVQSEDVVYDKLPDSVTSIGAQAFAQNVDAGYNVDEPHGIKHLTLSNNLTTIGSASFWGSGLEDITIPVSVLSVGSYAFAHSAELTEVSYNGHKIGDFMFANCINLTYLTIAGSCDSIGKTAFSYCTKLDRNSITYTANAVKWWDITKKQDWASKLGYEYYDPDTSILDLTTNSISNIDYINCAGNSQYVYDRDYYENSGYQYKLVTFEGDTIDQDSPTQAFVYCNGSSKTFKKVNISTAIALYSNISMPVTVDEDNPSTSQITGGLSQIKDISGNDISNPQNVYVKCIYSYDSDKFTVSEDGLITAGDTPTDSPVPVTVKVMINGVDLPSYTTSATFNVTIT